jgi:hypothetical protein
MRMITDTKVSRPEIDKNFSSIMEVRKLYETWTHKSVYTKTVVIRRWLNVTDFTL